MRPKQLITIITVAILFMMGACQPKSEQGSAKTPLQKEESVKVTKLDRQDLVNLMTVYFDALVRKEQSKVPIASNIKFVENTTEIPVGDGLWATASGGPSEFRIDAADPEAQQVASLAMMKENDGQNALAAIRLKVENGKITEAEHMVLHGDSLGENNISNLQKPRPGLLEDVNEDDRMPHEELIRIGLTYYDAVTGEDGTLAPFAKECERYENGMFSAGPNPPQGANPIAEILQTPPNMPTDCECQISTGRFAYITDIKERRLLIADVQKGLAVGVSMFWHDGKLKEMPIKGVEGITSIPAFPAAFNMPAMHFFKIKKRKIYEIEAIGLSMDYGVKSGW